jgi:hypothetical protein
MASADGWIFLLSFLEGLLAVAKNAEKEAPSISGEITVVALAGG